MKIKWNRAYSMEIAGFVLIEGENDVQDDIAQKIISHHGVDRMRDAGAIEWPNGDEKSEKSEPDPVTDELVVEETSEPEAEKPKAEKPKASGGRSRRRG